MFGWQQCQRRGGFGPEQEGEHVDQPGCDGGDGPERGEHGAGEEGREQPACDTPAPANFFVSTGAASWLTCCDKEITAGAGVDREAADRQGQREEREEIAGQQEDSR